MVLSAQIALGGIYIVNSVGDEPDDNPGDNVCHTALGSCTLRAAIMEANATAGTDTIQFSIPGPGVHTIQPTSPLPTITDTIIIRGYTQPGASGNTLSIGDNAVILIEIDGTSAGPIATALLDVSAAGSTIRGLSVINTQGGDGISLSGGTSLVAGNFIGLKADGSTTGGNGCAGVRTLSSGNTIGGTAPADRNVISATNGCGINAVIAGSNNFIQGNYIGTNAAGNASRGGTIGIDLTGTSHTVGGTTPGAGNLISGNNGDGIRIRSGTSGNLVQGNFIGTDAGGASAIGNNPGISITDAPGNTLGGTAAGARNVISGNVQGVTITGAPSTGNLIEGNFIGLNAAGTASIANISFGIWITSAPNNQVGSPAAGGGNVISGNGGTAISLFHADGTQILGNLIGTDPSGATALANNGAIFDDTSTGLVIGGPAAGAGNLISGNNGGISLSGSSGASILGNSIGINALGTTALPNTGPGISLISTTGTHLGGSAPGAGNVVSGNQAGGIQTSGGTAAIMLGNRIGTDRTGDLAIGNAGYGVLATGPALVGDGTAAGANVIAFNSRQGVVVNSTQNVTIRANSIFGNNSVFFLNSDMGIDLGGDGPTPNDPGDGDTGPNGLQNFPVLRFVSVDSSTTTAFGSLNSTANIGFDLDFYSNSACSMLGYGQGKTFLGTTHVTTDGSGNVDFSVSFPTVNSSEKVITATATDPNGNTSEFSACEQAGPARAFVSTAGSDANNCSIQMPCRTFASAILAVASGGEVIALNSGGFGPVTINKSVAILAPQGISAGITATSGNAITVAATFADVVTIRGLAINALGGVNGVQFLSGAALSVEGCSIIGFHDGIAVQGAGDVFVTDTRIRNSTQGAIELVTGSPARAAISRCRLENGALGLIVSSPSVVSLTESVLSGNTSDAVYCQAGELTVDDCLIAGNGTGVAATASSAVRISDSCITDNGTGLDQSLAAVFLSRGDNTVEGNGTDTSGTIGTYSPK
jgi:CSLREA domain-containing protein